MNKQVEKIKTEIEEKISKLNEADTERNQARAGELCQLLCFINSLEDEPDLNWKDMSLQEKKDLIESLSKDIPRFNVGDRIIHNGDYANVPIPHTVTVVAEVGYFIENGNFINMADQDKWELLGKCQTKANIEELTKLQDGIGQIAKVIYEYKGDENPTVEEIREILIENSFDRLVIRGELPKLRDLVIKGGLSDENIEQEITNYYKQRWGEDNKDANEWKERVIAYDSDELVKLAHHFANFGKTLENSISKDLDDEIRRWKEHYIKVKELGFQIDLKDIEVIAKYFAEWGKMQ